MASATRTAHACHKAATAAIISFPRAPDGVKGLLCARLNRAALLYEGRAARTTGEPASFLRETASQCRHYVTEIESGDPLAYALVRHFAFGLCEYAEARERVA